MSTPAPLNGLSPTTGCKVQHNPTTNSPTDPCLVVTFTPTGFASLKCNSINHTLPIHRMHWDLLSHHHHQRVNTLPTHLGHLKNLPRPHLVRRRSLPALRILDTLACSKQYLISMTTSSRHLALLFNHPPLNSNTNNLLAITHCNQTLISLRLSHGRRQRLWEPQPWDSINTTTATGDGVVVLLGLGSEITFFLVFVVSIVK